MSALLFSFYEEKAKRSKKENPNLATSRTETVLLLRFFNTPAPTVKAKAFQGLGS